LEIYSGPFGNSCLKHFRVLDHFTEKSFHRKILTERLLTKTPFDRTPFDRTPFDRKAIRPKHHLTEHRLTECHHSKNDSVESKFLRRRINLSMTVTVDFTAFWIDFTFLVYFLGKIVICCDGDWNPRPFGRIFGTKTPIRILALTAFRILYKRTI
jgi:hypothetical protein